MRTTCKPVPVPLSSEGFDDPVTGVQPEGQGFTYLGAHLTLSAAQLGCHVVTGTVDFEDLVRGGFPASASCSGTTCTTELCETKAGAIDHPKQKSIARQFTACSYRETITGRIRMTRSN